MAPLIGREGQLTLIGDGNTNPSQPMVSHASGSGVCNQGDDGLALAEALLANYKIGPRETRQCSLTFHWPGNRHFRHLGRLGLSFRSCAEGRFCGHVDLGEDR